MALDPAESGANMARDVVAEIWRATHRQVRVGGMALFLPEAIGMFA